MQLQTVSCYNYNYGTTLKYKFLNQRRTTYRFRVSRPIEESGYAPDRTAKRHIVEETSCDGRQRDSLKPYPVAYSVLLECSCLGVSDVWHLAPQA